MYRRSQSRQRGIGMLGFILIVGLATFFITILLKMGPAYLNYWTIRTIMTEVAKQPQMIEGGPRGILNAVSKRMDVNNLRDRSVKDDFAIEKVDNNVYNLILSYEDRRHLFFNVDAVVMFDYQVEVRLP
ncbi:DUF4845 domain-containing protein [Thiobaca trueperi]|uniref:Uncharacterized protein DUF4845 n=1 Tax=Thiobaca trueperi TaxID=127458 RepID=A0A4R3N0B3_9GAMM|nr:DUF4845 domain-containing protein [Thiobaca trueperi]TCT21441.1 uncharacterized protein DUF4845 [Thiobaca trueperi]